MATNIGSVHRGLYSTKKKFFCFFACLEILYCFLFLFCFCCVLPKIYIFYIFTYISLYLSVKNEYSSLLSFLFFVCWFVSKRIRCGSCIVNIDGRAAAAALLRTNKYPSWCIYNTIWQNALYDIVFGGEEN
jgi:hypothetical protein